MFISSQHAQQIVDEMKQSLHRDINIMDENGIILASTNPVRRGTLHQGAVRVIQERLSELTIQKDDPASGVQRGINLPISIDGKLAGVIGITGDPEEVSLFGEIIQRMTEILISSARQAEQSDLMDRAKSLFVENWLFATTPDWPELEIRGRLLGLDINVSYTVALLELSDQELSGYSKPEDSTEMRSSLILRMIQNHLRDDPRHYCAVIRSKMIILLCQISRQKAYDKITGICRDIESFYGLAVSGGISGASRDPMDIRRCYLEAQTANTVAVQSLQSRVVFYNQVSLEFILRSIPRSIQQDLHQLIFSPCTPQEREEFLQTILLYFDQDGDIRRCADKIFVHRNTFQYHIERIKRRTGYDLRVPKDAMLLYLATQRGK
ncbi:MAG: CdaR family transcriptional regulator [Lawsonibacter sp.]